LVEEAFQLGANDNYSNEKIWRSPFSRNFLYKFEFNTKYHFLWFELSSQIFWGV